MVLISSHAGLFPYILDARGAGEEGPDPAEMPVAQHCPQLAPGWFLMGSWKELEGPSQLENVAKEARVCLGVQGPAGRDGGEPGEVEGALMGNRGYLCADISEAACDVERPPACSGESGPLPAAVGKWPGQGEPQVRRWRAVLGQVHLLCQDCLPKRLAQCGRGDPPAGDGQRQSDQVGPSSPLSPLALLCHL